MSDTESEPSIPQRKKITVREFHQWISGIEELQKDTWHPSASQWKKIREKINDIDDEAVAPSYNNNASGYINNTEQFVATPAPINYGVPSDLSRHAAPLPAPSLHFSNADNPMQPARGPNLDTSNGQYTSSFA